MTVTTWSSATKRVRSSIWPSVSSPTIPSPSQITCSTPKHHLQPGFDGRLVERRIPVFVEQALFGGQQCTLAVHLDGTALEHHRHVPHGDTERLGHAPRNRVVQVVGRVLATPGVVFEIKCQQRRTLGRTARHEDCAVIPAPRVIGWKLMEDHALRRHPSCQQLLHMVAMRRIADIDAHQFAAGKRTDRLGHGPLDARQMPRPGIRIVRPGNPGRLMRRPLCRHAICTAAGRALRAPFHRVLSFRRCGSTIPGRPHVAAPLPWCCRGADA